MHKRHFDPEQNQGIFFFSPWNWSEESHLLPASGLHSQSETEEQTRCLQKQYAGSSPDPLLS